MTVCGCPDHEPMHPYDSRGRRRRYINHHHRRGAILPKHTREQIGETLIHHTGWHHSEQAKRKMSRIHSAVWESWRNTEKVGAKDSASLI